MRALVEICEELRHVCISQPRSLVRNRNDDRAFAAEPCLDGYGVSYRAMLDRIDKDVHQHGVALAYVHVHFAYSGICFKHYVDAFSVFFSYNVLDAGLQPFVEVDALNLQTVLSHLHLAQVKDHVQHVLHAARLPVYASECFRILVGSLLVVEDSLQRSHDQCQRCPEFVADVYEHLNLFLINPLFLLLQRQLEHVRLPICDKQQYGSSYCHHQE